MQACSPGSSESILNRRYLAPYSGRRVFVESTISPEEGRFVVRDEGPGFDTSRVPNVTNDPLTMTKCERRGLILIKAFMDEVFFNDVGNQITLIKRKAVHQPQEQYGDLQLSK